MIILPQPEVSVCSTSSTSRSATCNPRAQEHVAAWVVGLAQRGASVILASHALPFLALPTDEVEYVLVARDLNRMTRTTPITADVWGALDRFAEEAGVSSRAQMLQVVRGFIIVEGEHDAKVLNHFFHERLERARVQVLPTRGAKKVRSLTVFPETDDAPSVARNRSPMARSCDQLFSNSRPGRRD